MNYDMMILLPLVLLYNAMALWTAIGLIEGKKYCLTVGQSGIAAFVILFTAITLSFYAADSITQSSQTPDVTQSSQSQIPEHFTSSHHKVYMYHRDRRPFESPSNTFGDGPAKMWRM